MLDIYRIIRSTFLFAVVFLIIFFVAATLTFNPAHSISISPEQIAFIIQNRLALITFGILLFALPLGCVLYLILQNKKIGWALSIFFFSFDIIFLLSEIIRTSQFFILVLLLIYLTLSLIGLGTYRQTIIKTHQNAFIQKRGLLLITGISCLFFLHFVSLVLQILPSDAYFKAWQDIPTWARIYGIMLNLTSLILLIGIWFWKKSAVFISLALTPFTLFISEYIRSIYANQFDFWQDMMVISLLLALKYYPIFKKWHYFK